MSNKQHSFMVQSIVSASTGEAFVQIKGEGGQMTPDEARDLALNLLQAAEAADTDALIARWVKQYVGGDDRAVAVLLTELRKMRGAAPPQDWRK